MHKDTIVGIAGAAILVAAMVGVFWYEGGQSGAGAGARAYDIIFAQTADNGPSVEDTANEGETVEVPLDISKGNLVAVEFTLLWTDDTENAAGQEGEPDTFSLTVQGPEGTGPAQTIEGTNDANGQGEVRLVFNLSDLPQATTLLANSPEDAHSRAMANNAKSLGIGNWTVKVTLVEAGDVVAGQPILPGGTLDDSTNSFEVRTILHVFDAVVE